MERLWEIVLANAGEHSVLSPAALLRCGRVSRRWWEAVLAALPTLRAVDFRGCETRITGPDVLAVTSFLNDMSVLSFYFYCHFFKVVHITVQLKMWVFLKAYTYQQRGKKKKKKEKKGKEAGGSGFEPQKLGVREKFVGAGGLKFRTGPEDGCRALKLHSLTGHFKKTNTLQYHFLIRKS